MRWKFEGTDIHLLIEKVGQGHAVIGLGSSMADADVVQFTKTGGDGATLDIKDCILQGQQAPICTEASQDWTLVHQESNNAGFKAEIKRPATSTDTTNDKNFVNGAGNQMIWSLGTSNGVTQHTSGNYGTFTIDLSVAPDNSNTGGNGGAGGQTNFGNLLSFRNGMTCIVLTIWVFLVVV